MKQHLAFAFALSLTSVTPAFASSDQPDISPALMSTLNTWLDTHTEYSNPGQQPRIELVDPVQAEQLRGAPSNTGGQTLGLYDAEGQTIFLTAPWSPDNPRDISVLLHEMVHHRQASQHWYCPQAQEWRAYQIQAQWMEAHDMAPDFYWPAILLQSSCAKRDIHP